jgi:pantetheine-phosphate adenylyltransferase
VTLRRAVCPRSFDPVTNGHLDIIGRAAHLYDEVTVAIGINDKKSGLFTVAERMDLLREATAAWDQVVVASFSGLLVDFCRAHGIEVIVKGLRAGADFDYELQMAQMNRRLTGVETVFLPADPTYSYLSSSLIKEVAQLGGDIRGLVPDVVAERVRARLSGAGERRAGPVG